MTEKDFYRELMSRYALDPEKIRQNALKQAKKPSWQKFAADYWKPAAGVAAAVALTVSAVGYMNARSSGPDIKVDPASALSAAQRLSEAEQNYYNLQSSENRTVNMYITFREPVSCNDMVMAFSGIADVGEIEYDAVYLSSGTIRGTDEIAGYKAEHGDEKTVAAVKISTLSMYYRSIQDLSSVYLAEMGSDEINDDTFCPITVEDNDPLINDQYYVTTTAAATTAPVTTTPFSFDSEKTTSEISVPAIGESADSVSDTLKPPATSESDDPEEEYPEDDEEFEEPDETSAETQETAPETTAEIPANEITSTTYYGSDVGLLTEIYELNVSNSIETVVSGDNAVVLTKNGVYLYTLGGVIRDQNGSSAELNSPKVAFKNENTIIITGCGASGARNLISVADLLNNELHTYDVSANLGAAELGTIHYSTAQDKYFVKAISETSSFIYEVQISSETGIQFRPLIEAQAPVSVAGCKNNTLYLTTLDTVIGTKLYSFDMSTGDMAELAAFGQTMKIRRGDDFESFALISENDKYIFDANRGMLISVEQLNEDVQLISQNGLTYFRVDGLVYEIAADSSISAVFGTVGFSSASASEFRVNEITSEKVVVVRDNGGNWQ